MSSEPTRTEMWARLQEVSDSRPMTVYCALCPGWSAEGTAAETREASVAHRAKKHPDRVNKSIARKKRSFSKAMTKEREAEIDEERRQRMRALGIS